MTQPTYLTIEPHSMGNGYKVNVSFKFTAPSAAAAGFIVDRMATLASGGGSDWTPVTLTRPQLDQLEDLLNAEDAEAQEAQPSLRRAPSTPRKKHGPTIHPVDYTATNGVVPPAHEDTWTDEDRLFVIEHYGGALTPKDIAAKLGRTPAAIHAQAGLLRRQGYPVAWLRPPKAPSSALSIPTPETPDSNDPEQAPLFPDAPSLDDLLGRDQ